MDLYYEEMGSGIPLVLLHGFSVDHTIFLEMADLLKERAWVILPDLRGFGKSASGGREVSLPEMAGDLCELLDRLGIEKAVLGGHSMGGYVSLDFCRRWPERAAGLALIASHSAADTDDQRAARYKNAERVRAGKSAEYLLNTMLPKLSKLDEVKERLAGLMISTPDETLIEALLSMAERRDATGWLGKSGLPHAVIYGAEDQILPAAIAATLAALSGADPSAAIPAAGHMPMMENPSATAAALLAFLSRVETGRRETSGQ